LGILDEKRRRTSCQRQAIQIMIGDDNDDAIEAGREIADRCNCDARKGAIEVPMLKSMRVARDDRRFIAMHVIGVIAMTVGMVMSVIMFVTVMMRFVGVIVPMDVRIVAAAVPMMNQAHVTLRPQLAN
jgi:imidazoleglycerol phosphate dehydratase HisB